MRNLSILNQKKLELTIKDLVKESSEILSIFLDEISKILVILTRSEILVFSFKDEDFMNLFSLDKKNLIKLIPFNKQLTSRLSNLKECNIRLFVYKNEEETFHILLDSGAYISNKAFSIQEQTIEQINDLDEESKLVSAKCSPNLENIVLVYDNYTILLLNYEFEVLNRAELDDGEGTKDCKLDVLDYAEISFRGDGQYFIIHYSVENGSKTLVRDLKLNVFKSPAKADNKVVYSTAEGIILNYAFPISWQPSGSIIALFNKESKSIDFVEKNCLRHGEFKLETVIKNKSDLLFDKEHTYEVKAMEFSRESCILVLGLDFFKSQNYVKSQIYIFYRSNYDWTHKYSFNYTSKIKSAYYSFIQNQRLYVELLNETSSFSELNVFEFKLDYNVSLTNNNFNNDIANVLSVAGTELKFTPLKFGNVPPPLAYSTINTNLSYPYFISSFLDRFYILTSTSVLVFTEKNRNIIKINEYSFDHKSFLLNTKMFIVKELPEITYLFVVGINSSLAKEDLLTVIQLDTKTNHAKFFNQKIDKTLYIFNSVKDDNLSDISYFKEKTILKPKPVQQSSLNTLVSGLMPGFNNKNEDEFRNNFRTMNMMNEFEEEIVPQETRIHFFTITMDTEGKRNFQSNTIEISELEMAVESNTELVIDTKDIYQVQHDPIKAKSIITDPEDKEKLIVLCKNNKLYINENIIGSEITSFETYEKFLLITQNSNSPYSTLHLIDLTTFDFNTELKPNFESKSLSIRTIERGSVIVGVTQSTVTLQAQRGNLETFNPRILILNDIKKLIKEKNYKKSFELLRKHKINMNFIYEVNPEEFLANSEEIVNQIGKADYLNLLVNSLTNSLSDEISQVDSNVVNDKGIKVNIKSEEFQRKFIHNKINMVCNSFLKVLEDKKNSNSVNKKYEMKYLTTVLQIFCKKTPPEYLNALLLLKQAEGISADKGLEYLCWIVDANVLYNFALQTYDFELIIMVAKKTQKDPKEFLPYLEKLKSMDPYMMKYTINFDLKCYNQAIIELSKGGEKYFDLVCDTITKKEMFEICKEIYSEYPELKKKICSICAENLIKKSKFKEASNYALSGNNNTLTIYCFYKDANVNQVVKLLSQLENPDINDIFKGECTNHEELFSSIINISVALKKDYELDKINFLINSIKNGTTSIFKDLQNNDRFFKKISERLLEGYCALKQWFSAYQLVQANPEQKIINTSNRELVIQEHFSELVKLEIDLIRNNLITSENEFNDKYSRLLTVQMDKKLIPNLLEGYGNEIIYDDNFSETGSVISGASSHNSQKSKKSNASKLTKKAKNKLSKRNVKEGSPLEEEYLLIILREHYTNFVNAAYEKSLDEFVNVLYIYNNIEQAKDISEKFRLFKEKLTKTLPLYNVFQQEMINKHPEIKMLFQSYLNNPTPISNLNTK